MLISMAKVEIVGPKGLFFETVTLLHDEGRLHVEDLSKRASMDEVPITSMELEAERQLVRAQLEARLVRIRSLLGALGTWGAKPDDAKREAIYAKLWSGCERCDREGLHGDSACGLTGRIDAVLRETEGQISALAAKGSALQGESSLLARYAPVLEAIQPLAQEVVTTGAFDAIALQLDRRYRDGLPELEAELDRITGHQSQLVASELDDESVGAIIVFARSQSEQVHRFLELAAVNQIRLPSELRDVPIDEAYERLVERRRQLPEEFEAVRAQLKDLSERWHDRLAAMRDVLNDRISELSTVLEFAQTEYAFVVTGWVPEEDVAELDKLLTDRFKGRVVMNATVVPPEEYGEAPVMLRNSKFVAPFETLLNIPGAPAYGTIDPTWLVFIFYPIFFGAIVGDVGYGLIMAAVLLTLRVRFKDIGWMRNATSILAPAVLMAIVFGFVYEEYFGLTHEVIHQIPFPLLNRTKEGAQLLMILAVGVGFLQVVLGLILGIVNGLRTHHRSHVTEKSGLLIVLLGAAGLAGIAIFARSMQLPSQTQTYLQLTAGIVMFVGAWLAFRGGKIVGLVESVSQFGNVFSYLRIMAVGLAGAIIAEAANSMVGTLYKSYDGVGLVIGIFAALFLHTLNLVIASFSPNIHALRLNFLEFFGKFYESGGRAYRPFHKSGSERSGT
jgi:V/A-type H+/Na+-transporting ATPase subunit I